VLAYLPAVRGGFVWDDDAHVTKAELRSLHGLDRIWFEAGATQQYYPLLHSAFWMEHRVWVFGAVVRRAGWPRATGPGAGLALLSTG
jgi:hypothetical protein